VKNTADVLFVTLGVWLLFGLFILVLGAITWFKDRKSSKDFSKIKYFSPFTAGRLYDADGNHRADAFGIYFEEDEELPKPGDKIRVHDGEDFRFYTVRMCETLKMMGEVSEITGEAKVIRAREVYVLVKEDLSDSAILWFKQLSEKSLDSNRDAQKNILAREALKDFEQKASVFPMALRKRK
jgi:hypothetical protein